MTFSHRQLPSSEAPRRSGERQRRRARGGDDILPSSKIGKATSLSMLRRAGETSSSTTCYGGLGRRTEKATQIRRPSPLRSLRQEEQPRLGTRSAFSQHYEKADHHHVLANFEQDEERAFSWAVEAAALPCSCGDDGFSISVADVPPHDDGAAHPGGSHGTIPHPYAGSMHGARCTAAAASSPPASRRGGGGSDGGPSLPHPVAAAHPYNPV
ncbi:unnamed protein product [Miscanthus lutarioriparius]|uniref:Uncharacterized protein n=1 Tax=Miscanthus lutarioriparius TaxID=422564 RepID=A0A811N1H6_9POAL|nr:unnamed protein product [Miscanthus lutarioriparius]